MEAPKTGQRLRCATCGTEIVVVKAPTEPFVCCGATLTQRETAPATEAKSDG